MFILNIICYFCQEKVRKVAIFGEISAVFEVDKGDFGVDGGLFGFFGEFDEGIMVFCEVIIDEIRGGGAEDAFWLRLYGFEGLKFGGFWLELANDEAGEAEGGVARGVFLVIGGLMGFVDDDEAEVVNRGEEGGARTDDDEGFGRTVWLSIHA